MTTLMNIRLRINNFNNLKNFSDRAQKMYIFDMAGTTVNEKGLVYKTLKNIIKDAGFFVNNDEFYKFHGMKKYDIINSFTRDDIHSMQLFYKFEKQLKEEYFDNDKVDVMPYTFETFDKIRNNGDLVCLNTSYPREIASRLIYKLNLNDGINDFVCSDDVEKGRPYSYMINYLADKYNIMNCFDVIKIGDTVIDIEEGKNAGTGEQIAVLTGADNRETLEKAYPTRIIETLKDLF